MASTKLFMLLVSCSEILSVNVDCIVEISPVSANTDGANTSVTCSIPNHTLLSCGHRTVDINQSYFRGSWITGQTCWAKNGKTDISKDTSEGVYAIARCCDLSAYSFTCNTIESELSSTTDLIVNATCSPTENLMGCTVLNVNRYNRGCYPFLGEPMTTDDRSHLSNSTVQHPNSCIGEHQTASSGVRSYATCCARTSTNEQITIECDAVWSAMTNDLNFKMSCPNEDQFMTSCSAANSWPQMHGWEINQNNECELSKTPAPEGHYYSGVAICCSISNNASSEGTSYEPTFYPTLYPTIASSEGTSYEPTFYPTLYPTIAPVESTSEEPIYPTLYPTIAPVESTSEEPMYPTSHPTSLSTTLAVAHTNDGTTISLVTGPIFNPISNVSKPSTNILIVILIAISVAIICLCIAMMFMYCNRTIQHKEQEKQIQQTVQAVGTAVSINRVQTDTKCGDDTVESEHEDDLANRITSEGGGEDSKPCFISYNMDAVNDEEVIGNDVTKSQPDFIANCDDEPITNDITPGELL